MSPLAAAGSLALLAALAAGCTPAAAAPAAGDIYVYRLVNGFNQEVRGELRYRVEKADGEGVTVSVTPDKPAAGFEHTEIYTKDGNWLRRPLDSHGTKVEYRFSSPYPAYAFPLEAGKSWSTRVDATVPGVPGTRSVRVDGVVMGSEKIRVPAGEFDTVKVRRLVFPGDAGGTFQETRITQLDWYAPALGRTVRSEVRSQYTDMNHCTSSTCGEYGDWDIVELVDAGTLGK